MKRYFCFLIVVFLIACQSQKKEFEPNWESLKHPVSEWLLDAKFGIYAHWGVYSVPEYEKEWYAKWMYHEGHRVHHDGFLLWDSKVNRWNAGNMGPKRDFYGELVNEL